MLIVVLDKAILFLQNGMGHLKYLDKLKGEVYVGTVEHGAMRIKSNYVLHTGIGSTRIAPISLSKVQGCLKRFH